jgi:hypothetical protein
MIPLCDYPRLPVQRPRTWKFPFPSWRQRERTIKISPLLDRPPPVSQHWPGLGCPLGLDSLAQAEQTETHADGMESNGAPKLTELGKPLSTGEDPSQHPCDSDYAQPKQHDSDDSQCLFHHTPSSPCRAEKPHSPLSAMLMAGQLIMLPVP